MLSYFIFIEAHTSQCFFSQTDAVWCMMSPNSNGSLSFILSYITKMQHLSTSLHTILYVQKPYSANICMIYHILQSINRRLARHLCKLGPFHQQGICSCLQPSRVVVHTSYLSQAPRAIVNFGWFLLFWDVEFWIYKFYHCKRNDKYEACSCQRPSKDVCQLVLHTSKLPLPD